MKIGDKDFNFGRMLKVVLWRPNSSYGVKAIGNVAYVIEYCPYRDAALCSRIETNILDLPSPAKDDKPGFSSQTVIYNPNKELIQIIAQNAKWLFTDSQFEKLEGADKSTIEKATQDNLKNYYNQRLQISIYAGYWTPPKDGNLQKLNERLEKEDVEGTDIGYVNIFHGYVNETSLARVGQDDVLTIRAHDIDTSQMSIKALTQTVSQAVNASEEEIYAQMETRKEGITGEYSWDHTFKKLVVTQAPLGETVYNSDGNAEPLPRYLTAGAWQSLFRDYYKVYYVKDRNKFEQRKIQRLVDITDDLIDWKLKERMESNTWWVNPVLYLREKPHAPGQQGLPDWTSYIAYGDNRDQMLNKLCSFSNAGVSYYRVPDPIDNKIIYLVFPVGSVNGKPVPWPKADVKIYNYQNLLESPAVAGNGQLTVNMLFNPECKCWRNLALVLDESLTEEYGFVNLSKLETSIRDANGNLVGSLKSTSGMGDTVALTQLSSTLSVTALRKVIADSIAGGYMFNRGFLIVNVVHKLSTHSNAWSTTVKTMPTAAGILLGDGK